MNTKLGILAAVTAAAVSGWSQPGVADCGSSGERVASVAFRLHGLGDDCLGVNGGFTGEAGSFAGLSASAGNYLGLGETLKADVQYGVRLRKAQIGFARPFRRDKRWTAGFSVRGQRFHYDQERDASILAFSRDVFQYQSWNPDDLLNYVTRSYGAAGFLQYALAGGLGHVGIAYSYDVTGITPLTPAASETFGNLHYLSGASVNGLSGIRTSKAAISYAYNTVDNAMKPARGMAISARLGIAGLGGDVSTIEPVVDAKWFHRGIWRRHTIATHLNARLLTGYDGKAAPPYDRYYLGGEDEVRGFASWSVSPIEYAPGTAQIPVLNDNGTERTQMGGAPVLATIPINRPVWMGGDTKAVGNVEYRIPLVGPLTLALFTDVGMDRVTFANQLKLSAGAYEGLNAEFPGAGFADHTTAQSGPREFRMSSGVELQVMPPKVPVPVRLYWAYNVLACGYPGAVEVLPGCNNVAPPVVGDRAFYPNYPTFASAMALYGEPKEYQEHRSLLRIAVGFTF